MDNILNSRLRFGEEIKDGDLHLTEFDNRKLALTNIIDSYLRKNIDVNVGLFNFEKLIKVLSDVDNRIHGIIDDYKPKTDNEYEVVSILNAFKNSTFDFYLHCETTSQLNNKYHLKD